MRHVGPSLCGSYQYTGVVANDMCFSRGGNWNTFEWSPQLGELANSVAALGVSFLRVSCFRLETHQWKTERTVTISDELSYVRHMSPVAHPKSIVAQIFFAFQVTWDARGLRCTCARSRERESEMSGYARDCFGCVALGGG